MNKKTRNRAHELDSEAHFHAIFKAAIEGIITINNRGIIQAINPAAEKIFFYDENEVSGKNISILMPQPYRDEHNSFVSNYTSGGKSKIIGKGREVKGKRKNGEVFPMWLEVAEYRADENLYFTGFIKDLSLEKRYLEKVISYERIFEDSLNEIYTFDSKTLKFIHVNKSALLNLQYSAKEIVKLTPLDIKPCFTLEEFHQLLNPLKSGEEEKIVFVTQHIRKDGSQYPVEVHLELVEFDSRKVFVAIILDLTDKKNAEKNLKLQQEQLAHMDRVSMMGEMAAGIAHEINQPLTAISTYANAARRRIKADNVDIESLGSLLDKISKSSVRASDVISRLRNMLKPHTKKHKHLDINELIKETIELANIGSGIKTFDITLKLDDNLPEVTIDEVQIQQVILNLIRNAIDASETIKDKTDLIEISTHLHGDEGKIKVSVKDKGIGVDKEISECLFDPFVTTKGLGMGMGLTICQSIIQEHVGKMWFTKNSDKGVTFHFTIPTVFQNNHE